MARGFGAADGGGTGDEIVLTATPSTVTAYSLWFYITGAGGGNLGRLWDAGADSSYYNSGSGLIEFFAAWAGDDGNWSIPAPAEDTWHHYFIAYNAGDTANDPFIWLNGVSQSVTQISTPTSTKTAAGAITIGNRNPTSNRVWEGYLAEFAIWTATNATRAVDNVAGLAAGASPAFFPEYDAYIPMLRANVNYAGAAPTIGGTAVQVHPKIFYPRRKNFWPAVATVARSIDAEGGTYTITGTAASLEAGLKIGADSGSYAITGTDAGLTVGNAIEALGGEYLITGTAAGLELARQIAADSGAYTITGTAAGLEADRIFSVDSGSYLITGTAAGLFRGYAVAAEAGSYTITGSDAALLRDALLDAGSGSYLITGTAAGLTAGRAVSAESGSYLITGTDASLEHTLSGEFVISAEAGSYVISGTDADLVFTPVASGSYYAYHRKRRR